MVRWNFFSLHGNPSAAALHSGTKMAALTGGEFK